MARKIQEILLVANPYDAFILEEDGSLAARIINEYHGLNLSRPPRIIRATSGAEAMDRLDRHPFDLVLAMPNLKDTDPYRLAKAVKARKPKLPVVVLTHDPGGLGPEIDASPGDGIDQTFVWSGDSDLLLAIVKNAEDRLNVAADTQSANVRVLILVEDSPLYRSFLLPLIYREVVRQTQSVLDESLNEAHRLLKMRARPKILVAENFEQAMAMYAKFKPYVFGVVSDTRFPKCGKVDADAGIILLTQIKKEIPHLPLLLISSEPQNRARAESLQVQFVDKNDSRLFQEIRSFFLDFLGFGDFVFRAADGRELGRAASFRELEKLLPNISDEPIYYHACRNRFSNWFMARSEIALASILGRIPVSDFDDMDALRRFLVESIHTLRKNRQKGVVAQFSARDFDPAISDFTKIGNGSLGGKARGLAFFSHLLQSQVDFSKKYPDVEIVVPKTLVITTDGFDAFVLANNLSEIDSEKLSDGQIADRFQAAPLPADMVKNLGAFLERTEVPVSVRSSSLLEDAYHHPHAGLYKTYMIPNNHPSLDIRLQHLITAVKRVYASRFFKGPAMFSHATAFRARRDAMAVIIQQLMGRAYNDHFYPAISGVAQSWNYYPIGPMAAGDGIARIALGFGKAVVENEVDLRFSPRHPSAMPQFSKVADILSHAQQRFYALCLRGYDEAPGGDNESNLELRDVTDAQGEYPVRTLSSTYIVDEDRIRDSAAASGPKVMTFAQVLKYGRFPLAPLIDDLLTLGREGMGCDVEFEFCVDLAPDNSARDTFAVLQMRPMAAGEQHADVHVDEADRAGAVCYASQCLGNGLKTDMTDFIYVKPEAFDAAATVDIAGEIARLNAGLAAEKKRYLLAGPGRWGSADRWLGIPVRWPDIRQVGVMIEMRNRLLRADPSQGSHFFQQITAQGIFYATVTEGEADVFDWDWFRGQPAINETDHLRHLRLSDPFVVKADGHHGRCAILHPEASQRHSH
ncbi:MAG: phosphoenolpyruvate synthase/pyruvate phosphate dikinase [Desulfobacterales bacterium]|nr:phosphoenolpyruvate synthase/pyruvate phosphate dikinase [Desulfobacterales bacterium]